MHLGRTPYGYQSIWDRRLQFHRLDGWFSSGGVGCESWEVRINGRRGSHFFDTLNEAKVFARRWCLEHVEGHTWHGIALARLIGARPAARVMLRSILEGEDVADRAFLDLALDTGEEGWLDQSWLNRFRREMAPLTGEVQQVTTVY
jgi:hypothetical protein